MSDAEPFVSVPAFSYNNGWQLFNSKDNMERINLKH